MVKQRFERLNSSGGASNSAGAPASTAIPRPSVPRTNPDAGLSPEEIRIRNSPAIAKVTSFDPDWGYLTINGGTENNLTQGLELAVRRGHELLGLVKISQIYENDSEAELIGRWRRDKEMLKPRPGDDLLPYSPF